MQDNVRCPRCGSATLFNSDGDRWCSFVGGASEPACTWGCEPDTPNRVTDSPTGHDRAPDRYMAHGRETIDRQRDAAYAFAESLAIPGVNVDELADVLFVYLCTMQRLRYTDRAGLKGGVEEDKAKAKFYFDMAQHVSLGLPDPRADRPGFEPYQRRPFKSGGAS